VQQLVKHKLLYRIRLLEPSEGTDKDFDLVVHLASLKILTPEIFDDHAPIFLSPNLPELERVYSERKSEYLGKKNAVDSLVDRIKMNAEVKKLTETYNLLRHFESSYLKKKDEADYYLLKARKINAAVTPLNTSDLFALERSLRKDINKIRAELSDREAIKISLSVQNATALISVVSSIFLISGYLYNQLLLSEFGIEVSKFFTLTDYLASSIDAIRYSASSAVIGIAAYFWGAHDASRKSVAQIEIERKQVVYLPYIILLVAIFSSIFAYIRNSIAFYDRIYMVIIFASMLSAPWVARRYFKEPLVAIFLIVFLFTFSGHLFISVKKTIYTFKYDNKKIENYKIIFKKDIPIESSALVLIAGNSNYLFFIDEEKNGVIIPRDQVQYITKIKSAAIPDNSSLPIQ